MSGQVRTGRTGLLSALWLPLFDDLADPVVAARLAGEAEEASWHGVFVWDHVCWRAPVRQVADAWITLAAMAAATDRVRLGPMVTPLARRRPVKVATLRPGLRPEGVAPFGGSPADVSCFGALRSAGGR
jgi:Luciferase-like monooxygenase